MFSVITAVMRGSAAVVCDRGSGLDEIQPHPLVAEGDQGFISDDRLDLRLGFRRLRHQPLKIFAFVAAQAFSKTMARKPISSIEGRRRSFFNLVNVDGLKARQLVRVERDEDVADQPCLVAGEANRQSRLTILGQNGASSAIHVRDLP